MSDSKPSPLPPGWSFETIDGFVWIKLHPESGDGWMAHVIGPHGQRQRIVLMEVSDE